MSHSALLREFAITDFKIRYQDSALGYLWSFIKPLLMFGTLYLVFFLFLGFNIPHYPIYLFLGIIIWNFFVEATTSSIKNLIYRGELMKKIYFPRDIIVISSNATALITFTLNLFVFAIFFAFQHIALHWTVILFPLFVCELFIVSLGASFLVSALNVKLRDIGHIWEVMLQIGFWITPVMYSIDMIPQRYHVFLYLNPLTRIIQYARLVLIDGKIPRFQGIFVSLCATLIVFFIGRMLFNKMAPHFAEEF